MLDITHKVKIALDKPLSRIVVSIKQNDVNSRRIAFTLTENGIVYKLDNVRVAAVRGTKPDGNALYNDCLIRDNEIIYDITQQTITTTGTVELELVLFGQDYDEITSAHFQIEVTPQLFDDKFVESRSEYTILQSVISECVDEVAKAQSEVEKAHSEAEKAKESAEGIEEAEKRAEESAKIAEGHAKNAKTSATKANDESNAAAMSAYSCRMYESDAQAARGYAETYAKNAATSASAAAESAINAAQSESEAKKASSGLDDKAAELITEITTEGNKAAEQIASLSDEKISAIDEIATAAVTEINSKRSEAVTEIDAKSNEAVTNIDNLSNAKISNIESAGNTAVSNIEEKGNQTLHSIPEDYTALSNNVSKLTEDLTEVDSRLSESITEISDDLLVISDDIDFIKKAMKGIVYSDEVVRSFANEVTVPSGALEKAGILMIGGMSRKGKNLLNPTLESTEQNGVTCTRNADGTYTLNGTAIGNAIFEIAKFKADANMKIVGCPFGGDYEIYLAYKGDDGWGNVTTDIGNGALINTSGTDDGNVIIVIANGRTANNLIFKPMITTDLNATYDDYETYTSYLIDAPVDGVVSYYKGKYGSLLSEEQFEWLNNNYNEYLYPTWLIYKVPSEAQGFNNTLSLINGSTLTAIETNGNSTTYKDVSYWTDYIKSAGIPIQTETITLKESTNIPYKEYYKPIPQSIITKCPDYGIGVNAECYNYVDFVEKKYHRRVKAVNLHFDTVPDSSAGGLAWYDTNINFSPNAISSYTDVVVENGNAGWGSKTPCISVNNGMFFRFYLPKGTYNFDFYYELAEEEIIDLSEEWEEDLEVIEVEANGTVQFRYDGIEDYNVDVPNEILYWISLREV